MLMGSVPASFDRLLCGSQALAWVSPEYILLLICNVRPYSGRLAAIRGIPQREPHFLDYPFYRNIWTMGFRDLCLTGRLFSLPVVEPSRNMSCLPLTRQICNSQGYLCRCTHIISALFFENTMHPFCQFPGHSHYCYSCRHFL